MTISPQPPFRSHRSATKVDALTLTILAPNRVGLLAAVTRMLSELDASIRTMTQTVLGADVCLVLIADFPSVVIPQTVANYLEEQGHSFELSVRWKEPSTKSDETTLEFGRLVTLTLTGEDQPGMVHYLSSQFAMEGIDIRSLHATRQDGEFGPDHFVMSMQVLMPSHVDSEHFWPEIREWADSVGAEIEIQAETALAGEIVELTSSSLLN